MTQLDRATGDAAPFIDRFARFGFAIKGALCYGFFFVLQMRYRTL